MRIYKLRVEFSRGGQFLKLIILFISKIIVGENNKKTIAQTTHKRYIETTYEQKTYNHNQWLTKGDMKGETETLMTASKILNTQENDIRKFNPDLI